MIPTREMQRMLERLDTAVDGIRERRHRTAGRPAEELREVVTAIGEHLDKLGGISAMSWALDQIELRHPDDAGARAGILDHAWDGIGRWVA